MLLKKQISVEYSAKYSLNRNVLLIYLITRDDAQNLVSPATGTHIW